MFDYDLELKKFKPAVGVETGGSSGYPVKTAGSWHNSSEDSGHLQ